MLMQNRHENSSLSFFPVVRNDFSTLGGKSLEKTEACLNQLSHTAVLPPHINPRKLLRPTDTRYSRRYERIR